MKRRGFLRFLGAGPAAAGLAIAGAKILPASELPEAMVSVQSWKTKYEVTYGLGFRIDAPKSTEFAGAMARRLCDAKRAIERDVAARIFRETA